MKYEPRMYVDRKEDGFVPTSTIHEIAEELNTATSKMDKLLKAPNKLLAIHRSRGIETQGPPQPPTLNVEIAMSTEVDTYLRTVLESDTAAGTATIWRPGSSKSTSSSDSSRGQDMARATEATKGVVEVTREEEAEADEAKGATKGTADHHLQPCTKACTIEMIV